MKTEKIQSYITPKTTGYASAIGLGVTVLSGTKSCSCMKKAHKPFGIFTALAAVIHIAQIEWLHYKFKKSNQA